MIALGDSAIKKVPQCPCETELLNTALVMTSADDTAVICEISMADLLLPLRPIQNGAITTRRSHREMTAICCCFNETMTSTYKDRGDYHEHNNGPVLDVDCEKLHCLANILLLSGSLKLERIHVSSNITRGGGIQVRDIKRFCCLDT